MPAVMVSHESVTALLKLTRLDRRARSALSRGVADWLNRRTARAYHRMICTTGWAAAEFGRIDAGNVVRVPLGVDLDTFSPRARRVRTRYAGEGQILLVHCGRLSAEKRPQRSLTTLATLRAAGVPVRLVVAGDGPLRARLVRRAARTGLPVPFAGFLSGRADLAALLAVADVAIAPGAGRDLRAGRPGGTGLRDPGSGEARSPHYPRWWAPPDQCSWRGSRGRGVGHAGPAGTVPAGRRPRPRGAVRLGTAARGFLAAHGAEDSAAVRRRSA